MRTLFAAYEKLMDVIYSLIRICIAAALVVMVAVTFVEVIRRYVFGLSFIWSEELVRFLLVATSFLGGAAAYRAKALALLLVPGAGFGCPGYFRICYCVSYDTILHSLPRFRALIEGC